MWSLWRKDKVRGRRADGSAGGESSQSGYASNVGTILRQARQALGEDVRHCAVYLRIREPYLRAIEDGRYEDLPGRAYAIGFVRAYAVHLGLDGDKVVERFKIESGDIEAQAELVVPEPTAESSMPGGALVAASLLIAIGAYGGWYYVSTHHRLVTEAPAIDLPTRPAPVASNNQIAAQPSVVRAPAPIAAAPGAFAPSAPGGSAPSAAAKPGSVAVDLAALPPQTGAGGFTATLSTMLPLRGSSAPQPQVEPAAAAAAEDADEAEVTPAPEPLRPSAMAAATLQGTQAPLPGADAAARDAVARPPISASSAVAATVTDAAQRPSGPSRIVIRAIADSWLQVGDGRGTSLFAQVLRAGDSYNVPDRAGLRFDTGNAGGLEITVDGRPVPSVGPSGSVRRNIPLDIEKLVAGNFGQR